jgi:hypothetical protein
MWHLWYLMGAGAGFAAALFIIIRAAKRLSGKNTREARSTMIWSTVGALLMMPIWGVMAAAMIYMATP